MSDQDWTPVVLSKTHKQKTAGKIDNMKYNNFIYNFRFNLL